MRQAVASSQRVRIGVDFKSEHRDLKRNEEKVITEEIEDTEEDLTLL